VEDDVIQLSLQQLENKSLSVRDAEEVVFGIIFYLLGSDGFTFEHAPAIDGNFIDFIGRRIEKNYAEIVGIRFKHYKNTVGLSEIQKLSGPCFVNDLNRLIIITDSILRLPH